MATLFSFDYPPLDGGISRLCAELAAALARRGAAVSVLSQLPADSRDGSPPPLRVTARRPLRELAALRQLRRLRGRGPVVCGLWYPEGLLAALAGCRPRVVLAHGSELMPARARWRRGLWRRLLARTLRGADLVVANSSYTRSLAEKAAPGCRAAAIPLAVDHARFSPGDRQAAKRKLAVADKRVVLSVSRLHGYKGHATVFRALAALDPARRGKFACLIAGKGPDRQALEAEAKRLGVGDLVRWLGFVPEADLPDLYRAADLFALCTREVAATQEVEGFGLAFLEAQACGTPVVGARTGGIPDAVAEGRGGWLVPPDDHQALAGLLARLAADPAEFAAQGRLARERVERDCTWDRYAERFVGELTARGIGLG